MKCQLTPASQTFPALPPGTCLHFYHLVPRVLRDHSLQEEHCDSNNG